MKITFISDTHGKHKELTSQLNGGDMIVHAGDVTRRGHYMDVQYFIDWFKNLNYTHKIFIAGNHDFCLEEKNMKHLENIGRKIDIPDNVTYLFDKMINIDGIKIYGSPWQPRFLNWAFNVDRGESIAEKWKKIPDEIDILVTHGPAQGILDYANENIYHKGEHTGCEELYKKIFQIKPKIHAFGHIHEGYGTCELNDIKFINASVLNENYQLVNKPINIEI